MYSRMIRKPCALGALLLGAGGREGAGLLPIASDTLPAAAQALHGRAAAYLLPARLPRPICIRASIPTGLL